MGHYTGPKARVNRRLGVMIFENNGARKAAERRDSPPGMHVRRGKPSDYGRAMTEKQKIKYFYGLSERQLRRLFAEASRISGNTGENLLTMCEMRLDNVIRRGGLTVTRPQARQGVGHGHFVVNGRKCTIASRLLRPGDVLHVKPQQKLQALYHEASERNAGSVAPFLRFDASRMTVHVDRLPLPEEFSLPVNVGLVVELLSR